MLAPAVARVRSGDADRSSIADVVSDTSRAMSDITNPKVFISYSWSSNEGYERSKIGRWWPFALVDVSWNALLNTEKLDTLA
jgi:hypothetical protein